jgi:dihydropteroate synthase
LAKSLPDIPLSLDTRHADVAAKGLAAGATVINDVTGFSDPPMLDLALASSCGLIAMRSRRRGPALQMPSYGDPAPKHAEAAIEELGIIRDRLWRAGVQKERVLLDPGFGFGTTYLEDLALWQALPQLPSALEWPSDRLCLGLSRKRFLAAKAGMPELPPGRRDDLTASAHVEALRWGYRVFRTHAIG